VLLLQAAECALRLYLFVSQAGSRASGWHALPQCCQQQQAQIPTAMITALQFWCIDVAQRARQHSQPYVEQFNGSSSDQQLPPTQIT
jgi:hypothetical protein